MTDVASETHETTVEGVTHLGEGVVRIAGLATFVPAALPGEHVRVRVTETSARYARAELVAVLDPSPDRIDPPCEYLPRCGGCQLQHVSLEGQQHLKERILREQLTRIGGIVDPPVSATVAASPAFGYRNQAQFHVDREGRLGFHAARTHDVVPIDRCLLLDTTVQARRDAVAAARGRTEVVVRAHPDTGTAATIMRSAGGDRSRRVEGDKVLAATVGAVVYHFDPQSFFQVSAAGAEVLVATVLAAAAPVTGRHIWDLYSGVGLFAVPLALAGATVTAVEEHEASAHWADHNANRNQAVLDVVAADVAEFARRATAGEETPADVAVLDPPRRGAGTVVVTALANLVRERIIYVACDGASLARDAKALLTAGWALREVTPIDLFPQTRHLEAVAVFDRAG